jgi:hypothetical protein
MAKLERCPDWPECVCAKTLDYWCGRLFHDEDDDLTLPNLHRAGRVLWTVLTCVSKRSPARFRRWAQKELRHRHFSKIGWKIKDEIDERKEAEEAAAARMRAR